MQQSHFGIDYSKLDSFGISQFVRFFGTTHISLREDYKLLLKSTLKSSPLGQKRFRLCINILKEELLYIKSLYGESEALASVYHYFPNK